jgi:hypothetical protein
MKPIADEHRLLPDRIARGVTPQARHFVHRINKPPVSDEKYGFW